MELNNFYEKEIGLDDIEVFILGLLKNNLVDYKNVEKVLEGTKNAIKQIKGITKKIITINYKEEDLLKKIPYYINELENNNDLEKISLEDIKDFKKELWKFKNFRKKIDFLKKFLEVDNRMKYNRQEFLEKLANDFSKIDIQYNENDFVMKSNKTDIIDLPLSDINLDWHGFHWDNINIALEKVQIMIDKTIQRQLNSDNAYSTINVLFLGNIINRKLTLEQNFQETLINYNLWFEFSIFIVKATFLLKQYFKNVNLIFTIDKSVYRPKELTKEYFRNYNINLDRVIPTLVSSFFSKNKFNVNVVSCSEDSYYSTIKYSSWTACIAYWNIKVWNNATKANFNSFEKSFIKNLWQKENIKRISRIYIGWKDLFLYNDFYKKIRQIPSLSSVKKDKWKLVFFTLNNKWEELEKIWVDVLEEEPKVNLHNINYKNDIQFYDFIKNSSLTNKDDKQIIILKL